MSMHETGSGAFNLNIEGKGGTEEEVRRGFEGGSFFGRRGLEWFWMGKEGKKRRRRT